MNLEEITEVLEDAKKKVKEEKKNKRASRKSENKIDVICEASEYGTEISDKTKKKTDRLLDEEDEEVQSEKLDVWKPYPLEKYSLPEFRIPSRKSNNYETFKKDMLGKILVFVEHTQRKRFKDGCTVIPIPTTSKQNLMIWDYPMAITRAVEFMEEMGLITIYDDAYRFGVPYEGGSYGKLYAYYAENEKKLIQYCAENNIHKHVTKNVQVLKAEKLKKIETIDKTKPFETIDVRFGQKLGLEKPKGVSQSDFEMYLTQCLYVNYKELKFHQIKVDEINERFYEGYPEFKLRFRPHFTWKKNKVEKIGIRLTNEYCCKEKEERKELLLQYGFHLEKDVRSSVPRLTLSINEGHWIDEKIDIYELVNNEFDPGSEFTCERRENIKKYVLPAYFDKGSDQMLGKNLTYQLGNIGVDKKIIDDTMGRLRRALIKSVGGRTFGSDIFYVESCVYLMTLYDLLCSGHMVWLVYDAFYSNGGEDQETFEYMVSNSVRMNFSYFMEISDFKKYSKVSDGEDNLSKNTLTVKEVYEKYMNKMLELSKKD